MGESVGRRYFWTPCVCQPGQSCYGKALQLTFEVQQSPKLLTILPWEGSRPGKPSLSFPCYQAVQRGSGVRSKDEKWLRNGSGVRSKDEHGLWRQNLSCLRFCCFYNIPCYYSMGLWRFLPDYPTSVRQLAIKEFSISPENRSKGPLVTGVLPCIQMKGILGREAKKNLNKQALLVPLNTPVYHH